MPSTRPIYLIESLIHSSRTLDSLPKVMWPAHERAWRTKRHPLSSFLHSYGLLNLYFPLINPRNICYIMFTNYYSFLKNWIILNLSTTKVGNSREKWTFCSRFSMSRTTSDAYGTYSSASVVSVLMCGLLLIFKSDNVDPYSRRTISRFSSMAGHLLRRQPGKIELSRGEF